MALIHTLIGSFVRQVSLAFSANLVTALIFRASSMRYHLVLHAVGCFDTLFGTANRLKLLQNMTQRALLLQI
jgi:hypothetical protein